MVKSLRSRLFVSYGFLIVMCLIIVGGILGISLVQRMAFARLRAAVVPTALLVRSLGQRGFSLQEVVEQMAEQAQTQGLDIVILTRQGKVLAATNEEWYGRWVSLNRVITSREHGIMEGQIASPKGSRLYFVAWPMRVPVDQTEPFTTMMVALVTTPWHGMRMVLGDLALSFAVASVLAGMISLILAIFIARSISQPVQKIMAATEEIAR
ncbi:MAG: hypothetical protein ACUVWZ_09070, partial [Anaerolineae bacterium]